MPSFLHPSPLGRLTQSLLLLVLAGCASSTEQGETAARLSPLVEAVQARHGALPIEEVVPATVRARNQVMIRPEVDGRVVEVTVRSGASVRRGQPLVRLDDTELAERLRQAEADVRLTQAAAAAAGARADEVEARALRMQALEKEGLVSDQELESLEAQLSSARANADEATARVEQTLAAVDERRSALAKSVVRAPVAGRLGERMVEVGMQVDSTTVLFVVGDLEQLIAEVTLTEEALARAEQGQPVLIEPRGGAGGTPVRGTLARISPFLDADTFTTVGEIDVSNEEGRLRPGMFVTARILVGESGRATLVPVSALREDPRSASGRGVFVVVETEGLAEADLESKADQDRARAVSFRPVEVLAEGGGQAGVTGIDLGAWVVTVGHHLLAAELAEVGGESTAQNTARVRPVSWQRVAGLQALQNEDLLDDFLEKQRILAKALGATIPESESVVNRVLEEAAAGKPAG